MNFVAFWRLGTLVANLLLPASLIASMHPATDKMFDKSGPHRSGMAPGGAEPSKGMSVKGSVF